MTQLFPDRIKIIYRNSSPAHISLEFDAIKSEWGDCLSLGTSWPVSEAEALVKKHWPEVPCEVIDARTKAIPYSRRVRQAETPFD